MRGIFKICIGVTLFFIVALNLGQVEASYQEKVVRINHEDIVCDVEVFGPPGSQVQLMVLYENARTDVIIDDASAMENILYLDQIPLSESGTGYATFIAENKGLYRARVRGDFSDVTVKTIDNSPRAKPSGEMFAVAWDEGDQFDENIVRYVILSVKDIQKYGQSLMARGIKERLKDAEEGRKTIFISNDFEELLFAHARDTIWLDDGASLVMDSLKSFFLEFYQIGGDVDYIICDFETQLSNWGLSAFYKNQDEYLTGLSSIVENPLYESQLKPLLLDAGYVFNEQEGVPKLYDVFNWNNGTNNYLVWNGVMDRWLGNYWNEILLGSILDVFPNAKLSNYSNVNIDGWNQVYLYNHPIFIGGSHVSIGTHSSPVLYGGTNMKNYLLNYKKDKVGERLATHFDALVIMVYQLRSILKSEGNSAVQPWVRTFTGERGDPFLKDTPYYRELLYHVALYNPDPILFFGPSFYDTTDIEEVNKNVEAMKNPLTEINQLIGEGARKPIKTQQVFDNSDYLLSGMEIEDGILWRYTPNLFDENIDAEPPRNITDDLDDVMVAKVTEDGSLTLKYRSQFVTFPGGEIVGNADDTGFWIKTPPNTMPIERVELPYRTSGEFNAEITFYKRENGIKHDSFIPEQEYCAVVRYDNQKVEDQSLHLFAITYQGDRVESVVSILEFTSIAGSQGQFELLLDAFSDKIDNVRFYLWDSVSTVKPLTDNLIIKKGGNLP